MLRSVVEWFGVLLNVYIWGRLNELLLILGFHSHALPIYACAFNTFHVALSSRAVGKSLGEFAFLLGLYLLANRCAFTVHKHLTSVGHGM